MNVFDLTKSLFGLIRSIFDFMGSIFDHNEEHIRFYVKSLRTYEEPFRFYEEPLRHYEERFRPYEEPLRPHVESSNLWGAFSKITWPLAAVTRSVPNPQTDVSSIIHRSVGAPLNNSTSSDPRKRVLSKLCCLIRFSATEMQFERLMEAHFIGDV